MNRVLLHVGDLHDFFDRVVDLAPLRGEIILKLANENSRLCWVKGWKYVIV